MQGPLGESFHLWMGWERGGNDRAIDKVLAEKVALSLLPEEHRGGVRDWQWMCRRALSPWQLPNAANLCHWPCSEQLQLLKPYGKISAKSSDSLPCVAENRFLQMLLVTQMNYPFDQIVGFVRPKMLPSVAKNSLIRTKVSSIAIQCNWYDFSLNFSDFCTVA